MAEEHKRFEVTKKSQTGTKRAEFVHGEITFKLSIDDEGFGDATFLVEIGQETADFRLIIYQGEILIGCKTESGQSVEISGDLILREERPNWLSADRKGFHMILPETSDQNQVEPIGCCGDLDPTTLELKYNVSIEKEASPQLSTDLGQSFDQESFADVTLKCKDGEFRANKAILGMRNEYFRGMFSCKSKENTSGLVQFHDNNVNVDALKTLVRFLYTEVIPDKKDLTLDLLIVSDMFQCTPLFKACNLNVAKNLSMDNVTPALLCAHFHGSDKLKQDCESFIKENFDHIKVREDWRQNVREDNPKLYLELLEKHVITME